MKSPDEIKKGLECCRDKMPCMQCEYYDQRDHKYTCETALLADALALIQQLEEQVRDFTKKMEQLKRERDALLADLKEADLAECDHCAYCKNADSTDCDAADCDCVFCENENCKCKDCRNNPNWEWRGVQENQ